MFASVREHKKDQKFNVFLPLVWDEASKLWTISRDDGVTGLSVYQQGAAIDLAIREARHDHAKNLDVIVRVQQVDGTFRMVWGP